MLCWPLFSPDLQACSPGLLICSLAEEACKFTIVLSEHTWLQSHGCLCCALQVAANWTVLRYSCSLAPSACLQACK